MKEDSRRDNGDKVRMMEDKEYVKGEGGKI